MTKVLRDDMGRLWVVVSQDRIYTTLRDPYHEREITIPTDYVDKYYQYCYETWVKENA